VTVYHYILHQNLPEIHPSPTDPASSSKPVSNTALSVRQLLHPVCTAGSINNSVQAFPTEKQIGVGQAEDTAKIPTGFVVAKYVTLLIDTYWYMPCNCRISDK
jgi:hypothetical protein